MTAVDALVARTLGIDLARVRDGLEYQSVAEWDSLSHVRLMIALEEELGVAIGDRLMLELHSIGAIREFARTRSTPAAKPRDDAADPHAAPVVLRGLDGVHVDRTSITRIDGDRGTLEHRGYSIHDLVERSSFEETAFLLLHGELPSDGELAAFRDELESHRELPGRVVDLVTSLAGAAPIDVVRTGVSALGALAGTDADGSPDAARRTGIRLVAQVPALIGTHHAIRSGRTPAAPEPGTSHAEHFLTLLFGARPTREAVRFADKDLIVHADHSSNASAFAARVAIGCRAGLHAALVSAIATFSGALHGGAAEGVVRLIDDVGTPENAAAYVRERLARNEPVMGFGHRVYRTEDPRVRHLRDAARRLGVERGDLRGIAIVEAVVEAMEPYSRRGIGPNVDLYAGLAYRLLGLPDDLAVPMFVAGRTAGWVAQSLEQCSNNVLIRPLLHYVGPASRAYPAARGRTAGTRP